MFYSWPFGGKSVEITLLLSVGTGSVRLVYVWTGLPFQSKFCDAASLSCNPKKWMIYVTVTPSVQNNRDCTSHTVRSAFSTACGVFRETAMLIEWLEKNTDETFLAQAGWGRRGEAELQGFTTHIPKGTRTIPVWPEQRLHLFILLKMWILIKIFSYYNHVTVYWISGPHRRGDHICEISACVWLLQYIMQGNSEFAWLSDHQIERTLLFHAGFDL